MMTFFQLFFIQFFASRLYIRAQYLAFEFEHRLSDLRHLFDSLLGVVEIKN